MSDILVIFRNNLNGFWDFYHGREHGCWFIKGMDWVAMKDGGHFTPRRLS
jgi:hypothetical protein